MRCGYPSPLLLAGPRPGRCAVYVAVVRLRSSQLGEQVRSGQPVGSNHY
jgi:hypothetical protein